MEAKNDEVDDDDDDSSFDDDDDWWLEELLINIYQHDPTYKCSTKALCNIACHQTLSYIAMMMVFPPSKTLNSSSLLVVSLFSHSPLFPEWPSTSISCCSFDQGFGQAIYLLCFWWWWHSSGLSHRSWTILKLLCELLLWVGMFCEDMFFALHIFKTISYSSPNHFQIKFKPNQQPKEEHKTIRSLKNVWKCFITFIGCDLEEKNIPLVSVHIFVGFRWNFQNHLFDPLSQNEVRICFYP